jgi:hypothetical protein
MSRGPHPVDPRQPRRRNRQPDYRHGYIAGRAAKRAEVAAAKAATRRAADRRRARTLTAVCLLAALILAGALITWRTR